MVETVTDRFGLIQWSSEADIPDRPEFNQTFANIEENAAGALIWDSTGEPDTLPRPAAAPEFDRFFAYDRATGDLTVCVDTTGAGAWAWVEVSSDIAASEVVFTPSGGLAASDVQAALEELDAEKEVAGSTAAHAAAGDPHGQYRLEGVPIGTSDLADAAVTLAKLAFDVATQSELDAHAATSHGDPHPGLPEHDAIGLATQDELDAVDSAKVAKAGDAMTGPLLLPDGTVAAPAVGFSSEASGTGFHLGPGGALVAGVRGAESAYFQDGGFHPFVDNAKALGAITRRWTDVHAMRARIHEQLLPTDGTLAAPAYAYGSEAGLGWFRPAPGEMALALDNWKSWSWKRGYASNVSWVDIPLDDNGLYIIRLALSHGSSGTYTVLRALDGGTQLDGAATYSYVRRSYRADDVTSHTAVIDSSRAPLGDGHTGRSSDYSHFTIMIERRSSAQPGISWRGYTTPETYDGTSYARMAVVHVGAAQGHAVTNFDGIRISVSSGSYRNAMWTLNKVA